MHLTTATSALLLAAAAVAQDISMPPFDMTFGSAQTLGFYFQAPIGALVTGVRVYNELALPNQVVEIIDMNGAPPPLQPATAIGTQLFYDNQTPAGQIVAVPNVPLVAGGHYVFLCAATASPTASVSECSAPGFWETGQETFLGVPITLVRCDTLNPIAATGGPGVTHPISRGVNAVLSRAEVYLAPGPGVALDEPYGTGCGEEFGSFYEQFPTGAFDLSNSSLSLLFNGSYYEVVSGMGTWHSTANATPMSFTAPHDEIVQPITGGPMPTPAGATSQLAICPNGRIAVAVGATRNPVPHASIMLNQPVEAWYSWHDYDPTSQGGGDILWEETSSHVYVTWDQVVTSGTGGSPSTFQFQFEKSTGHVTFVWQNVDPGGWGHLVGYSPGGASADPGPVDISVAAPQTFAVGRADHRPLRLDASARPLIGTGFTLDTFEIPPGSALGATIAGLAEFTAGVPLAGFGMPGCFQYASNDAPALFVPGGTTAQLPFVIPNDPGLAGVIVVTQSAALAPGSNPLGIITSNGLRLRIDLN